MQEPGDVNYYRCNVCGHYIKTVHVDGGVTPMNLACRATERCRGFMMSMFYAEPPAEILPSLANVPVYEWYMPTPKQLRRMRRNDPETYEHCKQGGLLLRRKDANSQEANERGQSPDQAG